MNHRQLKEKMRQEAKSITPDLSEKLPQLSAYTDIPESPLTHRRHMVAILASAAACLFLVMGIGLYTGYQTEATIVLSVNPKVELVTNPYDQVIDAVALNADGEKLLQVVQIKNRKVGTAVSLLMAGMEEQGYLQAENQVEVMVQCGKSGKKEKLEKTIESRVHAFFSNHQSEGTVKFTDPKTDSYDDGTDDDKTEFEEEEELEEDEEIEEKDPLEEEEEEEGDKQENKKKHNNKSDSQDDSREEKENSEDGEENITEEDDSEEGEEDQESEEDQEDLEETEDD